MAESYRLLRGRIRTPSADEYPPQAAPDLVVSHDIEPPISYSKLEQIMSRVLRRVRAIDYTTTADEAEQDKARALTLEYVTPLGRQPDTHDTMEAALTRITGDLESALSAIAVPRGTRPDC